MSVINKLATALNRRDEVPNKELAIEIDKEAFRKVVTRRLEGLEKESQKKRIAKVLKNA